MQPSAKIDGQEVGAENQCNEHQGRAVLERACELDVRSGGGQDIDVIGQGHHGIEHGRWQLARKEDSGREHDCRRFTGRSADSKNTAG